ncbi:gamma-glutamylcyclotransferase [Microbulbifer sp. OS29]|uniref:Gamma-glutamylcyclotransferase n=1 Tax=Microbulbifer okhotskensis TaxID=2926617 RepID=A0A9X2ETZ6_9GAMM|nr:gamma-glutamylcyclotransferase family protein [Microbulbifer okhotskensis]MCO1335736.1 gamma-glutamylcyclotransferase [Microbulbifer okhotskensis]
MENLFSYGTLQQESVQLETFGRKLQGTKDTLVGYQLATVKISDPEVVRASGKEYHPILQYTGNSSDEVGGTVFELTFVEIQQSDGYEVDEYKRVSAQLKSGLSAWIYTAAG